MKKNGEEGFIAELLLPIALTGIVFEILLIAPTNNTSPFN